MSEWVILVSSSSQSEARICCIDQSEASIACYLQVRRDRAVLDTWDSLSLDNRRPLEAGAVRASHALTGLSPARLYRVKIGARNEFGWNYSQEEFVFGTKGAGKITSWPEMFYFKIYQF